MASTTAGTFEEGCDRAADRRMHTPRQSGIATTWLADIAKKIPR
jgi:hypothetical protein